MSTLAAVLVLGLFSGVLFAQHSSAAQAVRLEVRPIAAISQPVLSWSEPRREGGGIVVEGEAVYNITVIASQDGGPNLSAVLESSLPAGARLFAKAENPATGERSEENEVGLTETGLVRNISSCVKKGAKIHLLLRLASTEAVPTVPLKLRLIRSTAPNPDF